MERSYITIKYVKTKFPEFAEVEEMRYDPNFPLNNEIQVRCKNPDCPNSKEQNGWFTPVDQQLGIRARALKEGRDEFMYCSPECKP